MLQAGTKHTNDPQVLYNAKMEVIKELMDMNTSPLIYVQMNPNSNTVLKNGSTVEIFGWTDSGTKIFLRFNLS
jgi:hypothetical protein